jgi:hypothetical protein
MNLAKVLAVLDAIRSVGCRFWIEGGWGIDALVDQQTGPHRDCRWRGAEPWRTAWSNATASAHSAGLSCRSRTRKASSWNGHVIAYIR